MAKNNGFSLIELLIVIVIIGLFSGLSIAAVNGFSPKKTLEKETNKLADTIYLARKSTQSGDSCTGFDGFKVVLSPGGVNTTYALQKCCSGSCDAVQSTTLSSGVTLTNSSQKTVHFQRLSSGVILDSTPLLATSTIKLKNASLGSPNQCMSITVTSSGLISTNNTLTDCN